MARAFGGIWLPCQECRPLVKRTEDPTTGTSLPQSGASTPAYSCPGILPAECSLCKNRCRSRVNRQKMGDSDFQADRGPTLVQSSCSRHMSRKRPSPVHHTHLDNLPQNNSSVPPFAHRAFPTANLSEIYKLANQSCPRNNCWFPGFLEFHPSFRTSA